jgi:hypothetical protein
VIELLKIVFFSVSGLCTFKQKKGKGALLIDYRVVPKVVDAIHTPTDPP